MRYIGPAGDELATVDGFELALRMRMLSTNLAHAGALSEAARLARMSALARCPECGIEPCQGNHPGLAGPCCVCCPASPAAIPPGDE